jgi:uncharacterized protein (TIGR02145 family)
VNTSTNEYDFTAIPGGLRNYTGEFPLFANSYAVWWTATEYDALQAWNYGLFFSSNKSYKGYDFKVNGFSVRCIMDH